MKHGRVAALSVVAALLVEGCAAPPPGPTVFAARGQNVTPEQYQQADAVCQRYAYDVTARQADFANSQAVDAGVIGTLIGAVLGTLVVNLGKSYISEAWPNVWTIVLGGLLVGVVLFLPEGLVGFLRQAGSRLRKRLGAKNKSAT